MSILATVGQVTALLQTARGLVETVRGPRASVSPGAPGRQSFAAMLDEAADRFIARNDQDGTGRLSASEFPVHPRIFEFFDANGDGVVARDELIQGCRTLFLERSADRLIARYDAAGDGQLTAAELGLAPEQFARIDANGDGVADREELLAYMLERVGGLA